MNLGTWLLDARMAPALALLIRHQRGSPGSIAGMTSGIWQDEHQSLALRKKSALDSLVAKTVVDRLDRLDRLDRCVAHAAQPADVVGRSMEVLDVAPAEMVVVAEVAVKETPAMQTALEALHRRSFGQQGTAGEILKTTSFFFFYSV